VIVFLPKNVLAPQSAVGI